MVLSVTAPLKRGEKHFTELEIKKSENPKEHYSEIFCLVNKGKHRKSFQNRKYSIQLHDSPYGLY